ncbi:MAG: prepilin-type N-terminal cleavage/methylation domain-containing protein [Desulfobacteraceae bacterium]|jgi:type IV pilus assembly protein PilW
MTGQTYGSTTNSSGFTLVELMVALATATIFILATLTISDMSMQTYRAQERVSDAQQGVRAALNLMVRDIRMAGYDPMALSNGPTAGIGILAATDTKLQFSADLNADQVDSGGTENLTYFYDAANKRLRQKEGGKAYPQTFIENVSALKFSYLDAGGEPAAGLDDIVTVVVTLTVEDRYHKDVTFQRTLTTRINCRNLKM